MKTIVLDDDPTGTQSAADVPVVLRPDAAELVRALHGRDGVFAQTNSRALDEASAIALCGEWRQAALDAARQLGTGLRFVLRGDSTLRGHVFAETDVFAGDAVVVFVPAFPAGGRTTLGGIHRVRVGDDDMPAGETEYARDPVFPFASSYLPDYVAEKSERIATSVPVDIVRGGGLAHVLKTAERRSVVIPDAVTDDDIAHIATAIEHALTDGVELVVRCAAPLAARLAGAESDGLVELPQADAPTDERVLIVCGSHTSGARAQLTRLDPMGDLLVQVNTDAALADPESAGLETARRALDVLAEHGVAIISTERDRRAEHDTLWHGERVMLALTTAARQIVPLITTVVAKGGITSADIAREAIGATTAHAVGPLLPGVPLWRLEDRAGRELRYVIVPGNVGGPDTLVDVLAKLVSHSSPNPHNHDEPVHEEVP